MIFERVEKLKGKLNESCDVVIKEITCGQKSLNILFIKSVIDEALFIEGILSPIMDFGRKLSESESPEINLDILSREVLKIADVTRTKDEAGIEENLNKYKVLIFIEDEKDALAIDISNYPKRTPNEPPTSAVMKGPREGFVEDYKLNISMLRRRFAADKLSIDRLKIGRFSGTDVAIVYIKEIASPKLIKKVKEKLEKIDIDGIVDSHYLISFLQEKKRSIFKQVGNYEKPDVVASKILEGRVAIIVNNSPIVLTIPFIFIEDLQNSNDYYSSNYFATYIRVIRLIGLFIAVILPAIYVTLRLYHYSVMPINFLMTIGNSSETIPFTPFIEIVFILILFEILYEVSLRLPRYLGLATSIVGALILGETGVKAGLISSPAVMIIALSVIAVYTVPDQVDQMSLLRSAFLLIGPALGMFGIVAGAVFVIGYMNTLDSYSAAYLAPISPFIKQDIKDSLIKVSTEQMKTRPKSFKNDNSVRLKNGKVD